MGLPGVKCNYDRDYIVSVIKKHRGVVTDVSHELDVERSTLRKWINNDPELQNALNEARESFHGAMVDKCETRLEKTIGSEDEAISLKAIMFYLNTHAKGREMGYTAVNQPVNDLKPEILQYFDKLHDKLSKERSQDPDVKQEG